MSTLSKDQVKEIIKYNNFQSVADVSAYLRDIFKDTIQELLEAKLEAKLGKVISLYARGMSTRDISEQIE